jgi:predicted ATPase
MIKEIELENVRIFEGSGWKFPLRPLSLFCGTNSSGKSTLLKALLLIRQSQGIRESYGISRGKLHFVGSQVDLGSYLSFVSHNDAKREISLCIAIEDKLPESYIDLLWALQKKNASDTVPLPAKDEKGSITYSLRARFLFEAKQPSMEETRKPDMPLEEIGESQSLGAQGILKNSGYELKVGDSTLLSWEVVGTGKPKQPYEMSIPYAYFKKMGGLRMMDVATSRDKKFVRIPTSLRGLLPDWLIAKQRQRRSAQKDANHAEEDLFTNWPLPPVMSLALADLRYALYSLHYLAPLRAPAKRYYIAQMDASPDLDAAGEFLPYILREKAQTKVWNVRPKHTGAKKEPLSKALNSWIFYLRTGEELAESQSDAEIVVSTTKEVLVEFRVKTVRGTELHSMVDSGFGYSQVLPILVRGLMASRGSTLIIEQPELHLNPALQVRLAEFFAAMIRAGKQLVIETHSEHIVNAIRVLSAEDESGELASKSCIFFLDTECDVPIVRELSVRADGTVPEWPLRFFGEAISLTSRLLRAQRRASGASKKGK